MGGRKAGNSNMQEFLHHAVHLTRAGIATSVGNMDVLHWDLRFESSVIAGDYAKVANFFTVHARREEELAK